jgi:GT2 family glycosyltransferase
VTEAAFTVCMPTYRRPAALRRALAALLQLESPSGGYEIVVVDDGSPLSDGVSAVLEQAAASSPVPFRWERLPMNRGAAAARNRAWHLAAGEWVAFTDDDCVPRRDWLVRLHDHVVAGDADIVQGRTVPDPAREHLLARPFARSLRVERLSGYYETCNIAYRRNLLEQLDGFDESFTLACDDTDLGWRAATAGARAVFSEDAVVEHEVSVRDWRVELRSRRRWAETVKIAARHPEARRLAWRPFVYRKEHAPVLAALAWLPLAAPRGTRPLWLAASGAAVAAAAVRAGSPSAALTMGRRRLVDAYEVAVLMRASVRQRTVLL